MPLPLDFSALDTGHDGLPYATYSASDLSTLDTGHDGLPFYAPVSVPATVMVTQIPVEVLVERITRGRVTQLVKEVLIGIPKEARITQIVVEVLVANPSPGRPGGSWNVFRPNDLFDIYLQSGAVASATDDLAVLNGANLCVVGSEVLQFRDVTSLGDGRYRLSYLLRGRFGTEWAMNTHDANEPFVLLTANSIRRIRESTADLDQLRFYKAVSFGATVGQTFTRSKVDTGVSLTPYSPYDVRGVRDGSDNLTITWKRRTRVSGEWRDYVDVPLGEAFEAYEVDIIDPTDSSVSRTIEVTEETASYSAADQTTDFGAPQDFISVIVYQLSGLVGRGYGSQKVL